MQRVNYPITTIQAKKLEEESKNTGLSVAELIHRAIDRYFQSPVNFHNVTLETIMPLTFSPRESEENGNERLGNEEQKR